jgi:hypothetical protein
VRSERSSDCEYEPVSEGSDESSVFVVVFEVDRAYSESEPCSYFSADSTRVGGAKRGHCPALGGAELSGGRACRTGSRCVEQAVLEWPEGCEASD